MQNGEVDWWETPLPDLVPLLKQNPELTVDIADPLGNIGSFRINHLYPPFNDVRAPPGGADRAQPGRLHAGAVVGEDPALWKPIPGFFTPGTPLYTENGGDTLKGNATIDAAKLLADAGYKDDRSSCWWRPMSRSPRHRATSPPTC